MATRKISLSEEAYEHLKRLKRDEESFSDLVIRLTTQGNPTRFSGSISEDFADDLEEHTTGFRSRFDRDFKRT